MTDTHNAPRKGGLSTMLLADLKSLAGGLGIRGAGSMKKAQLVEAIKAAQAGGQASGQAGAQTGGRADRSAAPQPERTHDQDPAQQDPRTQSDKQNDKQDGKQSDKQNDKQDGKQDGAQERGRQAEQKRTEPQQGQKQGHKQVRKQDQQGSRSGQHQGAQSQPQAPDLDDEGDDDEAGSRRNRRRRGRDRDRNRALRNDPENQILEDDVLVPAAGILDVLDNYAFVRTSGYLAGPEDVYLSLSMVRKYGLRRGDAVAGQVRQPREGERKEKFNPMVRIDSVNGSEPDSAKSRPEFGDLVPLHPDQRLRMEKGADDLIGRVIDLAAPIGKGQRGLVVSPGKAGKTSILQSIAASVTANNPECHLMVVLVDERPEEVTDFQRSVKGEVIASTFDRPPSDHTTVAELAIERAKRLVELGHDVVVLLDGITRLGRAYHLAASTSGRVLSGGIDSSALYPPKKFFGAARNIEDGGSLTILATAVVESGSSLDELIFEEFDGTSNMELRLRRDLADLGLFPAVDLRASGTRSEDRLLGREELHIVGELRRSTVGLTPHDALEQLLQRVRRTSTNIELLTQIQRG